MISLLAAADPLSHVLPHKVGDEIFSLNVGGGDLPALGIYDGVYRFYLTNHLIMSAVAAVLVVLVFWLVSRRVRVRGDDLSSYETRGRVAQMFETMCAFIRDEVARPNLRELTDKYIYYIWTIFFFVLFANLLGLVPIGYIVYLFSGDEHHTHLGGTATSNLSLNVILALGSFVAIVFIGIRETGVKAFFAHFNPVGWDDPKMLLIGIPLYILEWMGLAIKIVVLAMRLFGTMMAGHLVIAAFVGLINMAANYSLGTGYGVGIVVVLGSIVFSLLEIFICFLQAFIFTFLTVLFISMTASHHGDEHHELNDESQMDLDKVFDPERIRTMPDPSAG